MREKIKKRFLDILFEPEEPEAEPVKTKKDPEKTRTENPVKARDVLYQRQGGSAFIDLNAKNTKKDAPVKEESEYELSAQISPIFGLIKESKPKKVTVDVQANEAIVNKPEDSHLDIPTSPIYGYASKEEASESDFDVQDIFAEDANISRYVSDEDYDDSEYYDDLYEDIDREDDDEEINLFNSYGDK